MPKNLITAVVSGENWEAECVKENYFPLDLGGVGRIFFTSMQYACITYQNNNNNKNKL